MNRSQLEDKYIRLGNYLAIKNNNLNFKNHCYWRIANDNACNTKWNKKVQPPFYKNASTNVLKSSITNLEKLVDHTTLYDMNEQSLNYRR